MSSREGSKSEIKGTAIQKMKRITPTSHRAVPITVPDGSLGNSDIDVGLLGV
jgi:hypothetical protein